MTMAAFSILHGHGDLFAWLARGFATSIGFMLAREMGWPVASAVLCLGGLLYWWRKRRATRRRRNEDAQYRAGVYSADYESRDNRPDYGTRDRQGRENARR